MMVFVPARTPNIDLVKEVAGALQAVGVNATWRGRQMHVDGHDYLLTVTTASHPTPGELGRLPPVAQGTLNVIVADRLSKGAREALQSLGYSWLDRRGHLRLWTQGLRLDVDTEPSTPVEPRRVTAVFSPVGMEVALALLLQPESRPSPRGLALDLGRSPGHISTVLQTFRDEGLLDGQGRALHPELFWALADAWPRKWQLLVDGPEVPLRYGGVVSGQFGAAGWGAPVLVGFKQPLEILVGDERTLRRILNESTVAPRATNARSAVRVDPLGTRSAIRSPAVGDLALAHPVVCALDLVADVRGRETVANWEPRHEILAALAALDIANAIGWAGDHGHIFEALGKALPAGVWWNALAAAQEEPTALLELITRQNVVPGPVIESAEKRLVVLAEDDDRILATIARSRPEILNDHLRERVLLSVATRLQPVEAAALLVQGNERDAILQSTIKDARADRDPKGRVGRILALTEFLNTDTGQSIANEEATWVLALASDGEKGHSKRQAVSLLLQFPLTDSESRRRLAREWIELTPDWYSSTNDHGVENALEALPPTEPRRLLREHLAETSPSVLARFAPDLLGAQLMVRRPAPPEWRHQDTDKAWVEFLADIASHADLLSAGERTLLLEEALRIEPRIHRISPLLGIVPSLAADERSTAIEEVAAAAQTEKDLHRRARWLARAAAHATDGRDELIRDALVAARAAVGDSRSDSRRPGGGGIGGLLEVAAILDGEQRTAVLEEATHNWCEWVQASHDDPRDIHMDHDVEQLARLLTETGLAGPLGEVLTTARAAYENDGNGFECLIGYCVLGAIPASSLELVDTVRTEAEKPTAYALREPTATKEPDPDENPMRIRYPNEIRGFRRVW